jgi:putative phosphoribosyl transferase
VVFADRRDAGRRLAELLVPYGGAVEGAPKSSRGGGAGTPGARAVVVGLPRGGVVVAAEVALRLGAPLDIVVVRKLGCPWQPELGIGAIAEGDIRVLNDELVREVGVNATELEAVTVRERAELERRVARYRAGRARHPLQDRVVIVVDDGLATGYTARAAIASLRAAGARRVILAVPVAPEQSVAELGRVADAVVVVDTPPSFYAIGAFYADFGQTSDEEVIALLTARAGSGPEAGSEAGAGPRAQPG